MKGEPIDLSVVLCVSDQGNRLHASVLSLYRAVEQARVEGAGVEVVAVVHGEHRATRLWLEEYFREPLLESPEACPGAARNAAFAHVSGRHVACLEGGEMWSRDFLARGLRCARDQAGGASKVWRPEASIGFPDNYFDAKDRCVRFTPEPDCFPPESLLTANPFPPTFLAARGVIDANPFPEEDPARGWGEVEWWWSANLVGAGVCQPPVPGTLHYFPVSRPRRERKGWRIGPTVLEQCSRRKEPW